MLILQLVKLLSLLRSYLASVRVLLWKRTLCELRPLHRLFLRTVCRILCPTDLRRSRPRTPPPNPRKAQEEVGRQDGHQFQISSSSLSSYTVVLDGAIVPLNEALFSINPRSAGDSFRNSSTALVLPNRQGSQLSLRLSSKSIASAKGSNSRVATPAGSTSTLPFAPADPQDTGDVHPYPLRLHHPERQETRPPNIEVVQAPNDSPVDIHIPGTEPVLSDEHIHDVGPNRLSKATLQVPGGRTPSMQGSSSRPYSLTGDVSLPDVTLAVDLQKHGLTPVIPSETLRYKKRKKIERKETDITLSLQDCNAESFLRGVDVPLGWKRLVHPEGGCYFYHQESRMYTDNEIYDPVELGRIQVKMNAIEVFKITSNQFPVGGQIVLNVYGDKPEETQCYCVNHADRMIFFLTEFHTKWMDAWHEAEGAYSRHHLRHELEAQYWQFVHLYPDSIKLSKGVIDDLKDALFFFSGDVTTSAYSTSPYNSLEITNLLNMLPMLEGHINSETSTSGSVEFIARIMFLIYHNRFLNFYGEPCARLERDFSVYGPDVHLTNLQKMWVDQMLHTGVWKQIMSKFSSEWQELVAFSTIMLNANVAFLAIQSVDNAAPSRSWAQIFSYASTIANVACMILGLLLMRQNRTKRWETTELVYEYLQQQHSELTGLEALAIMFSLPHASLMWGMLSFFVAFSLMCVRVANIQTRIVVISCLTLATLYIIWCIYLGWETNPEDTSQDNRSWAYIQDAELEAEAPHGSDSYESSTEAVSTADTSSRPRPRIPGIEAVTKLWNAFLCIFIRSGRDKGETQDMELHEISIQAPENFT